MFRKAYRLPFTLLGIPVLLDVTFLIILPVFALSIAGQVDFWARQVGVDDHPSLHREWVPYLLGLVTAVGLFVSVILHELGHSVVAMLFGVKVRSITLWLLGGVAQFEDMPRQRGAEAAVAIAGPLVSIAVAVGCWVVQAAALPRDAVPARFVFAYLSMMNFWLAAFNMIPALPLDGGRVLRSLLALRLSYLRATQVAAAVSRFCAVGLALFGLLNFNVMLVLVAFFIYMGVNAELRGSMVVDLLDGARVRDLMNRRVTPVPADLAVAELARAIVLDDQQGFPVVDAAGRVVGMVCIDDLRGRPPAPDTTVAEVMRPQVHAIRQDAPALEAMQRMSRDGYSRLLVVDASGQIVGSLTNTDLLRAMEARTQGLHWGVRDGAAPAQVVVGNGRPAADPPASAAARHV
jgi:Zn-dependent protease/predicted transcriptional regulator